MKRTEPPLKCGTMAVQIKQDSSLIHFCPAGAIFADCQDRKYGNLCSTGEARGPKVVGGAI
jgi:hypothetical protein